MMAPQSATFVSSRMTPNNADRTTCSTHHRNARGTTRTVEHEHTRRLTVVEIGECPDCHRVVVRRAPVKEPGPWKLMGDRVPADEQQET
jgi:hypothetical protein